MVTTYIPVLRDGKWQMIPKPPPMEQIISFPFPAIDPQIWEWHQLLMERMDDALSLHLPNLEKPSDSAPESTAVYRINPDGSRTLLPGGIDLGQQ
jgi:hypothetical protein